MADGRRFQEYVYSMHAIGRPFQLGDLYDYRTDQIIQGIPISNIIFSSLL